MKIIKKNVYYCEFCKKRSLASGSMKKHEKHCTKNIDRECGVCNKLLELGEKDKCNLKELVEKYKKEIPLKEKEYDGYGGEIEIQKQEKEFDGKKILEDTNGCPACALAIINIGKLNVHPNRVSNFDFKEEMGIILADINEKNLHDDYGYY